MGNLPEPNFNFEMEESTQQEQQATQQNVQPQQPVVQQQVPTATQQGGIPQPTQQPTTNFPVATQQVPTQPQINQQVIQQQKAKNGNGDRKYPPRMEFYTKSSALLVSVGDYALFFEVAPALQGQERRYNWQGSKIMTKMGIEEIDQILDCLRAYKTGGPQAFQQYAKYYNPQGQGELSFYHQSQKGSTVINLSISQKSGLPVFSFYKTDQNGQKVSVHFTILPAILSTVIRTLDRYADLAISKEK